MPSVEQTRKRDMKNDIIRVLSVAVLATGFVTQAEAGSWFWQSKAPVKTEQLALPANNGGMISVTVPSKTASTQRRAEHLTPAAVARRAKESANDQREDERIAGDLERHF